MLDIILDQFLGPENESGIIFSKIDTDRSIYRFSIDRCIDISILKKNVQYSRVAYHFGSIFWSPERIRHYFVRKSIPIDQYIDFRSIDVSILKKLSNIVMLHIILDQFLGPENESGIIFSKIDTDRSIYRFSIDPCLSLTNVIGNEKKTSAARAR